MTNFYNTRRLQYVAPDHVFRTAVRVNVAAMYATPRLMKLRHVPTSDTAFYCSEEKMGYELAPNGTDMFADWEHHLACRQLGLPVQLSKWNLATHRRLSAEASGESMSVAQTTLPEENEVEVGELVEVVISPPEPRDNCIMPPEEVRSLYPIRRMVVAPQFITAPTTPLPSIPASPATPTFLPSNDDSDDAPPRRVSSPNARQNRRAALFGHEGVIVTPPASPEQRSPITGVFEVQPSAAAFTDPTAIPRAAARKLGLEDKEPAACAAATESLASRYSTESFARSDASYDPRVPKSLCEDVVDGDSDSCSSLRGLRLRLKESERPRTLDIEVMLANLKDSALL